jgi:hypothetical protein
MGITAPACRHTTLSQGTAAGIGSSQLVDLFHPLRGQPCLLIGLLIHVSQCFLAEHSTAEAPKQTEL